MLAVGGDGYLEFNTIYQQGFIWKKMGSGECSMSRRVTKAMLQSKEAPLLPLMAT